MAYKGMFEEDLMQTVPGGLYTPFQRRSTTIQGYAHCFAAQDYSPVGSPAVAYDVQQVPLQDYSFTQQSFSRSNIYPQQTFKVEYMGDSSPMSPYVQPISPAPVVPIETPSICESSDLEQMRTIAIRRAMLDDSVAACKTLSIPTAPKLWCVRDLHAWILWVCQQYNLGYIDLTRFNCNGSYFCQLDEYAIKVLANSATMGEIIYELLQMMISEAKFEMKQEEMHDNYPCNEPQQMQLQSSPISYVSVPATPQTQNYAPSEIYEPVQFWESSQNSPASMGQDSGLGAETISDVDDNESENGETGLSTNGSHTHLWQFLKELLQQPAKHASAIRWVDRSKGVFKIEDSVRVAKLWGKRKNRPAMNYDKLSRSIRQYYKKGIMKKTERSQRLVYQFCAPYNL